MTTQNTLRALIWGVSSLSLLAACGSGNESPASETQETANAEAQLSENERFDAFLAEATATVIQSSPELATQLALSDDDAGGYYKDKFSTPGIAGYLENQATEKAFIENLSAIDASALSPERREYHAILSAQLLPQAKVKAIADEAGIYLAGGYSSPYVVNQISGVHVDLPQFMTSVHPLTNEKDAASYVTRLNLFDEQFAGAVEILEANASVGALPPDYAIDGAIANASLFISSPVGENPLYTHFARQIDELGLENADTMKEQALEAVSGSVYPAYSGLIEALEELRPRAVHDAGIWSIPSGAEIYEELVLINGENNRGGDGVHELGLQEVARIQSEMEALFKEIGMTEGSIGERLAALTADPEQLFPDTPEGKEELLAYVRQLANEADEVMADYFLETPSIGFEVRPVPAYAEQGAPGGYYNSPAEDGSRPGIYFINLRTTAAQPKFSLPTLTYHEPVPGHHFQLALATDAKDTPLLVRLAGSSNGYAEGWALYSEQFAAEIGLYDDDPTGDIGRLRDELFRAVRLVVDSGMHAKKWSREEAIDYMVANAGMEVSGVTSEIERYSVWPGQALAYKTGMLKIQELRARAEAKLGDDFELPAFHYEVLRGGGAPLAVLEQRIDGWIEAGGPTPTL